MLSLWNGRWRLEVQATWLQNLKDCIQSVDEVTSGVGLNHKRRFEGGGILGWAQFMIFGIARMRMYAVSGDQVTWSHHYIKKNMTDFLQIPSKLFSKKKKQINKSKQKASIGKTSSWKATINSLHNFDKKELLVPLAATKTSESKAKDINISMISTDTYCAACHLKRAQVFAISMRDI